MIHVLEVVVSSAVCTSVSCWRKLLTHVLPPLTLSYISTCLSVWGLYSVFQLVLIINYIGSFSGLIHISTILFLQMENGEEVEIEEFYVKYKNL